MGKNQQNFFGAEKKSLIHILVLFRSNFIKAVSVSRPIYLSCKSIFCDVFKIKHTEFFLLFYISGLQYTIVSNLLLVLIFYVKSNLCEMQVLLIS